MYFGGGSLGAGACPCISLLGGGGGGGVEAAVGLF